MQVQQNDNVLEKEMLGLVESALKAFLATLDEKRLVEISKKLMEAYEQGTISSSTFNFIAGIIATQWADRKIQPIVEKFYKKSAKAFSISELSAR